MTFEEFIAACASAKVVFTADGEALLIGNKVVQFKGLGLNGVTWFANALRMIPQTPPSPPV